MRPHDKRDNKNNLCRSGDRSERNPQVHLQAAVHSHQIKLRHYPELEVLDRIEARLEDTSPATDGVASRQHRRGEKTAHGGAT